MTQNSSLGTGGSIARGRFILRCRVAKIALAVCAIGLAVAGCKNSTQLFQDNNEGGWFSKPADIFAKPSWARATSDDQNVVLNPRAPVDGNELVTADGRCGEPAAAVAAPAAPEPAAAPTPPADRPVGTVAGDYARAPMPEVPQAAVNPNVLRSASRRAGRWSWAASRSA